jgi:outer membrane protein TolC
VALLSILALPVRAQQPADSAKRISLEEAVAIAVRENPELAAARFEVEKAGARVSEAWGYALPRLDLSARYSRAIKKPVFFLPDFNNLSSGKVTPIEIGSTNSLDMTVTASQVLFNSAVFTGVGTARIYSNAARALYRAKEIEVVTAVRKAYYGALLAAQVLSVARDNLRNAEDNLRNVRILFSQGLVAEYDMLRASVGVDNLRPEITRSENTATLAQNGVKLVLGRPSTERIEVMGTLEYRPVDSSIVASAPDDVLLRNPGLAALRFQLDVSDAVVAIERSNYLPSLAAFGNYQLQTQKNDFRISTQDFVGSALVGLSLSLNVFNGLQTNARVEQAQLDMKKSQQQIAALELQLRTGVEAAALQLRRIGQRIAAQEETIRTAEKGYAIATTRYRTGSGTQLEVNDAQLALTQSKLNLIQTTYEHLVASADLDQLLGRLPAFVAPRAE